MEFWERSMDGGSNPPVSGKVVAENVTKVMDFHAMVTARVETEGKACRDSLFYVYTKQGSAGLCKLGSKLTEEFFEKEFAGFRALGMCEDQLEHVARQRISGTLNLSVQAAIAELQKLGDRRDREIVDPCLVNLSGAIFWVVEWRRYVKSQMSVALAA